MKKSYDNVFLKKWGVLQLLLVVFFYAFQSQAQTYPVQVIPQVSSPPPVYLSEYTNTTNSTDRIKAQLLLTDLTVLNREVRLKLYIEGNNIQVQSKDFVIGAPQIFLDGGIPLQLANIDLVPYFELQNLQGISAGAYANELPEGLLQFCFEVYDVLSGNVISRKSCTNVLLFLNDPPFLNLPTDHINLEANNPQNILFQWTPRHINVSNVEYEFSLVEIWDNIMDPQAVFVSSPPFYQTTTRNTTLLYGLAEPQLLEGKRYAWRVQAKALSGVDQIGLFKNKGYSEIFSFTYQGNCAAPTALRVAEVTSKTATFHWQGTLAHTEYKIEYRKAVDANGNSGNANSNHWFDDITDREELVVIDLEPNTTYQYRVGGYCMDGTLTYTTPLIFTTMEADTEAYYNCGIAPSINISNTIELEKLQNGDVIKAGDFNVKIQETLGTGSFTGKGYTTVGFLKNIKIALVFTDIKVNTDFQLLSGTIKTVYDPTWNNILDIDTVIDEVEDIVDVFTGDDDTFIDVDYDITNEDAIVVTNGQIVITDTNGDTHTYDYDEGDTYTISANGNEYSIDANGEVTQTGTAADGGQATAANTSGISDTGSHNTHNPSVNSIEKSGVRISYGTYNYTKYGLDKADNSYEKEKYKQVKIEGGDSYYPVHKAVTDGDTDVFYADIFNNNTTTIKTDELIFKTVSGKKIDAVKDGTNRYKITVKGTNFYHNEEAIITYKDKTGKQHVLSSFFIHHIKKHPNINVQVVLVHSENTQAQGISGLKEKLNSIYTPAGVPIVVGNTQNLTISKADWDIENSNGKIDYNGSGLDSDYPQELNAIKRYYKSQNPNYNPKAYYIFVLNPSIKATKALSGFMPKTRQWGYVFQAHTAGLENKPDEATTIAHELGHGVFALGHPFGKNPENAPVADTWLMDYANGTELAYPNWAYMSDKGLKLYLFQDDKESEQVSTYLSVLSEFANKDANNSTVSYSFLTPSNKVISLPPDIETVVFSTYDSYILKSTGEYTGKYSPMGSLIGFIKKGKHYSFKGSSNNFSYKCSSCSNEESVYKDIYTKNVNNITSAIVALPYFNKTSKRIGLYANKIQIDESQIIVNENGVENFGKVSENYSVIQGLNNPQSTLSGYYLFFEKGKGKKITQTNYTELTPYAIEFLNSFPKSMVEEGSIFSPVLVSTAIIFSKNEALENLFKCEVLGLKDTQKRSLDDIRKSNPSFLPIVSLAKSFRTVQAFGKQEDEFKQLIIYYHKLRELLKSPNNISQVHKNINDKIEKTDSSVKLIELINSSSSCTLENITLENRIVAIKKILKDDSSSFNDDEEDALMNLINAVTFNNQAKKLLTELFEKDNSKLFRDIWKSTNFSEFNEYINKITEIYKVDQTSQNSEEKFIFNSNSESSIHYKYSYTLNNNGTLNVVETQTVAGEFGSFKENIFHYTSLTELVEITFVKNSYIEYDKNQNKNVTVNLPAYYLAYLINNKQNDETINAVRVFGNLVAILTAIPSSGQSLTAISLIEGLSFGIATADLVMVFTESDIKKLDGGQEFVEIWNYVTLLDAGIGITRLATSIVNGTQKIAFNFSKFSGGLKQLSQTKRLEIVQKLRKIPSLLIKLKHTPVNSIFTTKILSKIEAGFINANFTPINNASLKFTNWTEGFVEISNKSYKILELSHTSNGGFSKFSNLKTTVNSGDELIGTIENVRYQKFNSNSIVDGDVKIYKTADNIVYVLANAVAKFTTKQIDDYVLFATKQGNQSKVMLGLYDNGGASSYISKAGNSHTYFDMGTAKWTEAENIVGGSLDEMWKINKKFIDEQKALGKEFWFSHDPFSPIEGQFYAREINYLIDEGVTDFVKIGDSWKAIW